MLYSLISANQLFCYNSLIYNYLFFTDIGTHGLISQSVTQAISPAVDPVVHKKLIAPTVSSIHPDINSLKGKMVEQKHGVHTESSKASVNEHENNQCDLSGVHDTAPLKRIPFELLAMVFCYFTVLHIQLHQ